MSSSSSAPDPLNPLAEEFVARYRRGERPPLTEYTDQHPELAEQIRAVFPALVLMEQEGSVASPATGPDLHRETDGSPVPGQLGDYRILREVGRGGMGVVYEAVQESLGRHVALKVLPLHGLASPTHRERFRREAQAAARLHHSNIVPVFGVGEHDGLHYYAMQFIHGMGLDGVLQELQRLRGQPTPPAGGPRSHTALSSSVAQGLLSGRFLDPAAAGGDSPAGAAPAAGAGPPAGAASPSSHSELTSQPEAQYCRSVARLGVQVAEALDYAHHQGILHRDIKPSNLLLDTQGTVWITDFGLAKAEGSIDLTSPGDLVGTLRYMAPERLQGQSEPRGDVYSLGLTLYELLTLQPAFADSNRARLIERVTHEEPSRPRQLDRRIPQDLETIVLKAMAKEPGRRYPTAAALAEDLRRFLADRPIRARRTSAAERLWRWCRRNRAVAGLLATLALFLVAVAGAATLAAFAFRDKADALETNLYFNHIGLAYRELQAGNLQRGVELLEQCPSHLRSWEWHYLQRMWRAEPVLTLNGHTQGVVSVAFSPDGQRLASSSRDKTVRLWDVRTGREILRLPGLTEIVFGLAYSPDGRRLAVASADGTVRLWDATTEKWLPPLLGHTSTVWSVAYSPDGQLLASAGEDLTVRLWDTTTGQEKVRFAGHSLPVLSVAFSPDGRHLASGSFDATVKVWDPRTGQLLRTLEGSQEPVSSVAFSPDGRLLAAASWDYTVPVWETSTGHEMLTIRLHREPESVAFSPDGRRLVVGSSDKTVQFWDVATNQEVLSLRSHTNPVLSLAFSADGRRLASAGLDRSVKIWDATPWEETPGQEPLTLQGHDDMIWGVAFSPDGRRLASASRDMTVRVWDAITGQETLVFRGHTQIVFCVAFSPDGQQVASASKNLAAHASEVKIWDATTGAELRTLLNAREVFSLVFSPDGRHLVTGGIGAGGSGGVVKVWDPTTGQATRTLEGHAHEVWSVAFTPDGRRLASSDRNGVVKLWDATTGRELLSLHAHHEFAKSLAIGPDGRWIASASSDRTIKLWDLESALPVVAASTVGFLGSPWGSGVFLAASGLSPGGAIETRQRIRTLEGHTGEVFGVAFSPDGQQLASASLDGTVKLWKPTTGAVLHTFRGHTGGLWCLAFSPDGKQIASAGFDQTVKVWKVPPLDDRPGPGVAPGK